MQSVATLLVLLVLLVAAPAPGVTQIADLHSKGLCLLSGVSRRSHGTYTSEPTPAAVIAKSNETATELLHLDSIIVQSTAGWLDEFNGRLAEAAGVPAWCSLILVLGCGLASFIVGGLLYPQIPERIVPYLVAFIYIVFSVSIDLTIAFQKVNHAPGHNTEFKFNPACVVCVTEGTKLMISSVLYIIHCLFTRDHLFAKEMSLKDPMLLSLPAVIFAANNILVFKAIGTNDISMFGIFRDTLILWIAVLWKFVFQTDLGNIRIAGIGVILCGLVLNQSADAVQVGRLSWGFVWVLVMTLCNASASVANEYALKSNKSLNINLQNCILYIFCMLSTLMLIAVTDVHRLTSVSSFLGGFTRSTWVTVGLQSLVGLLVSRLLKLADSVTKTVATCLRGPLVTIGGPSFVNSHRTFASVLSAIIVASGAFTYLFQGPIAAASKPNFEQADTTSNCRSVESENGPSRAT